MALPQELSLPDYNSHPWAPVDPNYPFHSPLDMDDGVRELTDRQQGTDPFGEVVTGPMSGNLETAEETSRRLLLDTTPRFHSTRPHPRESPIPGSGPMLDQMTTTGTMDMVDPLLADNSEMYARIALGGAQAASLDRNLGGSPSWNSAMTPMLDQLDRLYQFQARQQASVHLVPQHRLASSPARSNSRSTIAHRPQQAGHPHSPQPPSPQPPHSGNMEAHRYSQELRRQQEDQLRRMQQPPPPPHPLQRERRTSEEDYLLHMSEVYRQSPHPHTGPQYYPPPGPPPHLEVPAYGGDMDMDIPVDMRLLRRDLDIQLGMDGPGPDPEAMYRHLPRGAYHHLGDVPHQLPLDLQGSPAVAMIKFESPLE